METWEIREHENMKSFKCIESAIERATQLGQQRRLSKAKDSAGTVPPGNAHPPTAATGPRWVSGAAATSGGTKTERTEPPSCYSTSGNALLAVERLERAAERPNTAPWALGPKRGIQELARDLSWCGGDAGQWVELSVRNIVVQSAAGSVASAKSALRSWAAFADEVLGAKGQHLPPTPRGLAAWSCFFRCSGTFANYVSYLKLGCHVLELDTSEVDGPLVKRAKAALKKRAAPPREKRYIRSDLVRKLVNAARGEGDTVSAMLYIAAYSLMLRVPSEGLPMTSGPDPEAVLPDGQHSCAGVAKGEFILRLARRKNKLHGSILRRACSCAGAAWRCPVHTLGEWLQSLPCGSQPFLCVRADVARAELRRRLAALGFSDSAAFNLHDFRRGHAHDLAEAGGGLKQILDAGEWVSPAFLKYLDTAQLEKKVAVQACLDDSEDDG